VALEELGYDCSAARSDSAEAKQVRILWGSSVMMVMNFAGALSELEC